jgi:hypothetical protein
MVVGAMANWPWGTGVPVPLSGMARFGFDASETIAIFPVSFPVDGGVKVTLNVKRCPGVSSKGGANPLILKPVPVILACEI